MSEANESRGASPHVVSRDSATQYFGCEAKLFLTRGAVCERPELYRPDYLRRQAEFVSCLVNGADESRVYDLRFVSVPDAQLPSRGSIRMALLTRCEGVPAEEAELAAVQLLRLLQVSHPEVDFELLDRARLEWFLQPFQPNHVVSFTRRWGWQPLDSLRGPLRAPVVGYRVEPRIEREPDTEGTVFHVFPFASSYPDHAALFRLLLFQPASMLISFRLRPTRLGGEEEGFLEAQIAQCEKYSQLSLGGLHSGDLSFLKPTLQNQARLHVHYLIRALHALKDDAALMTCDIASPKPVPTEVAEALGHFLSEPAPATRLLGEQPDVLSGGFELVHRRGDAGARDAIGSLDLAPPALPDGPLAAARLVHLFDPAGAVAAFRVPQATDEAMPGVQVRRFRYREAPPTLPTAGVLVGSSGRFDARQNVRIGNEDRLRHAYIVGQTGTGKTTLLRTMILDDIAQGSGVCVIDPHGDLFREVLAQIPEHRIEDVVVLDPADTEYPVGLNLLEHRDPTQRHFIVHEVTDIVFRLIEDVYGTVGLQYLGPIFFQQMRNNLLLVMSDPDVPGTLVDLYHVFTVVGYWRKWVPVKTADPQLESWVEHELPHADFHSRGKGEASLGGYVSSKIEEFVFDPLVRNIFGQRRSTIDFRAVMDGGKILLVNLAKGLLSGPTSRFLGMVVLAKLQAAAMTRVRARAADRRPFYAYVDEFQSIATESFIDMLSEGRKFGLGMVLANQFVSQLANQRITQSIFGNAGTLVAFRMGQPDAELMERYMSPPFTRTDLTTMPNWYAAMTTLVEGQTLQPFSVETIPPKAASAPRRAEEVRQASRRRHGAPRARVEADLAEALKPRLTAEEEARRAKRLEVMRAVVDKAVAQSEENTE